MVGLARISVQGNHAHVIEYFVALAGVVRREQLQIFIFHPSAALVQQHLGFIEVAERHAGFTIAVMDDADVVV